MKTEITQKTIKIARTRSGAPCLWESLIKFDDLKRSTVILDSQGLPKVAAYLNDKQDKQALVPIVCGDHIAKTFEDKNGIAISVFVIENISSSTNEATVIPVYRKSSLVTDFEIPEEYKSMVETSLLKLNGKNLVVSLKNDDNIKSL